MISIAWVGQCSPKVQKLNDFLEFNSPLDKNIFLLKNISGKNEPSIIISEELVALQDAGLKYSSSIQIYICNSTSFLLSFQQGTRPPNRFYFHFDEQTVEEFIFLVQKIGFLEVKSKKNHYSIGLIPSMQNSMEVLRRITEDRLFELRNFSNQEEDRRKNFHSLIQLARGLSMSRDIEEVVQYLWGDLRSVDGLKSITLLVTDPSGHNHQILPKQGKFHFQEIQSLNEKQNYLIRKFIDTSQISDLVELSVQDREDLNLNFKMQLRNPYLCYLNSENSTKNFFIFLETNGQWKKTKQFESYLHERLLFVHLTLEKHLLQEEIKIKARLWASTFDDLQDPLAIITQGRNIIRANHQFQTFHGSVCHKVWAQSESLCHNCPKKVLEKTSFEIQIEQKIYQVLIFPIFDDLSSPSAMANSLPSFSDRILKNKKIQEFHSETLDPATQAQEKLVASGTEYKYFIAHYKDITTDRILYSRLIQSEKMIAVGKLAGDLSQALSFPLKKIIQVADKIVHFPELSQQSQVDLNEMRKASLRSLRIIEDFENFSKGLVEKNLVMAETVIEKTIPLIKALIHGHRFNLQLSEVRHPINASLSLLQQVLYNLLRNANQAMKSHGELQISTETKFLENKRGVLINVIDSGTGIPEHLRIKIFQPFVTSKGSSEGTGLGLNIVKQIVENHLGRVGYEPRVEGGSKFWIWLPTVNENTLSS